MNKKQLYIFIFISLSIVFIVSVVFLNLKHFFYYLKINFVFLPNNK